MCVRAHRIKRGGEEEEGEGEKKISIKSREICCFLNFRNSRYRKVIVAIEKKRKCVYNATKLIIRCKSVVSKKSDTETKESIDDGEKKTRYVVVV